MFNPFTEFPEAIIFPFATLIALYIICRQCVFVNQPLPGLFRSVEEFSDFYSRSSRVPIPPGYGNEVHNCFDRLVGLIRVLRSFNIVACFSSLLSIPGFPTMSNAIILWSVPGSSNTLHSLASPFIGVSPSGLSRTSCLVVVTNVRVFLTLYSSNLFSR